MDSQIFIMIRFNINFHTKLTNTNSLFTGLKKPYAIWDEDRLNYRFKLFENVCLPSILAQNDKENLNVILIISEDFPDIYKERLKSLIDPYPFISTEIYDGTFSSKYLKKYLKPTTKIVTTMRMDDDDAIAHNLIHKLKKYSVPKHNKKVVTFINGFFVRIEKSVIASQRREAPLIAVGLAYITDVNDKRTVYSTMKHRKLGEKFKVIYDRSPSMWVVLDHVYGDEGRLRKSKYVGFNEKIRVLFPYVNFENIK